MRKNKKKKDNLRRNLVLFGFLLIIVSFIDTRVDKKDISLIAINEEENYTNVNAKELLSVLDKETAVVLVIDDKRDISKIINILNNLKENENIYVYNDSSDEIIVEMEEGKVKVLQEASEDYNYLIKKLGNYTEKYYVNGYDTGYRKINTPIVLFVKNGFIEYSYFISTNIDNDTLNNIYSIGFQKIR